MTKYNTHKLISFLVNLIIIGLLIYLVKRIDSDKSFIIFGIFYPLLIIMNGLIFIALWLLKSPYRSIYSQTFIGLILLIVPFAVLISGI